MNLLRTAPLDRAAAPVADRPRRRAENEAGHRRLESDGGNAARVRPGELLRTVATVDGTSKES